MHIRRICTGAAATKDSTVLHPLPCFASLVCLYAHVYLAYPSREGNTSNTRFGGNSRVSFDGVASLAIDNVVLVEMLQGKQELGSVEPRSLLTKLPVFL